MIVTPLQSNQFGRVVLQADHTILAHELCQNFGNQHFEKPEPAALIEFLAMNHDRGWDEVDANIGRDPDTGLPYGLVRTPMDQLLASGPRSVEFNCAYHPYCGLLSSMHVWGLFNGRYGLSDKIVVDMLQGQSRIDADRMLQDEQDRQSALKAELEAQETFRDLIREDKLMQNYKLLQFFDTFSLHLNTYTGEEKKGSVTEFQHVPMNRGEDCTIRALDYGNRVLKLDPFPFGNEVEVSLKVYKVPVLDVDVDYQKVFKESETTIETFKLVV